jgi:hypothetical protein
MLNGSCGVPIAEWRKVEEGVKMLLNIAIGALLIAVTCRIHAEGMLLASITMRSKLGYGQSDLKRRHIYWVVAIVLILFLVAVVQVLVWALVYVGLDAIQGLERALYFSMVTFTTLGYGDVVLTEDWRLLASIQAVNGIILFGWSTAIVLAAVQSCVSIKHGEDDTQIE